MQLLTYLEFFTYLIALVKGVYVNNVLIEKEQSDLLIPKNMEV